MNLHMLGISGTDLVHELFYVFIIGICLAVIYFAGSWFWKKLAKEPAQMVWDGLFIVLGVILIINFLLTLVDHPFIRISK